LGGEGQPSERCEITQKVVSRGRAAFATGEKKITPGLEGKEMAKVSSVGARVMPTTKGSLKQGKGKKLVYCNKESPN